MSTEQSRRWQRSRRVSFSQPGSAGRGFLPAAVAAAAPRTQQPRRILRQRHHRRFNPQTARSPSRIIGTFGKLRRTCWAVVGDTDSLRLALGAASGRPVFVSSASATGWAGTRIATDGSPALTSAGCGGERGSTSDSGPGQKRCPSRSASVDQSLQSVQAAARLSTWTISDFGAGDL